MTSQMKHALMNSMQELKTCGIASIAKAGGEYHDLNLYTDVGLLADVFENFRDMAMQYYGLDPAHYLTLPHVSWDAMLKFTGVQL